MLHLRVNCGASSRCGERRKDEEELNSSFSSVGVGVFVCPWRAASYRRVVSNSDWEETKHERRTRKATKEDVDDRQPVLMMETVVESIVHRIFMFVR